MKGFAMLKIGEVGWIEKDVPKPGPLDAICKPLAIAICTSDVHTVWEGAVGDRHNMILGHEGCAEVVEVGSEVKDFKPGDKVLVVDDVFDTGKTAAAVKQRIESTGAEMRMACVYWKPEK
ncbi:MAG: alcohol dehydrogenase catalytic domain-containing protein, partial [Butyrivibrio sp.]|nr:alcohol dehydrogenase catalytic domain-containing protein [Butyrivibrio sp.]